MPDSAGKFRRFNQGRLIWNPGARAGKWKILIPGSTWGTWLHLQGPPPSGAGRGGEGDTHLWELEGFTLQSTSYTPFGSFFCICTSRYGDISEALLRNSAVSHQPHPVQPKAADLPKGV